MRRLTIIYCLALSTSLASATPTNSQERSFALRDGGTGMFLDGDADHTIIARPGADGIPRLECIRGDHHAAAALLRSDSGTTLHPDIPDESDVASRLVLAGVSANMRFDPDQPTGVDGAGRVLLYMPNPIEPGSSGSHFDPTASPNLLMEPAISPDLAFAEVDLTDDALRDMGWRPGRFRADVRFTDDDDTGFNDPILGTARRDALEFMLDVWGQLLGSASAVTVDAGFADLSCSVTEGAVLAQAGPQFVYTNFTGAARRVLYPGPMAESIARADLSGSEDADLVITFNAAVDDACLGPGTSWYYGLDDNASAAQVAFLPVALHEMAHGLGFVGLTNLTTGEFFFNRPDILATMTFDNQRNKTWDEISKGARRKSAVRDGEVAFTGAKTKRNGQPLLRGAHVIQISDPVSLEGTHIVGRAFFGPALDEDGLTDDLALVDDGTAAPTLGCAPLVNGAEIAGNFAVVRRGECFFTEKVQAAQDAGALGVVVVNNVDGPPIDMAGDTGSIRIPKIQPNDSLSAGSARSGPGMRDRRHAASPWRHKHLCAALGRH